MLNNFPDIWIIIALWRIVTLIFTLLLLEKDLDVAIILIPYLIFVNYFKTDCWKAFNVLYLILLCSYFNLPIFKPILLIIKSIIYPNKVAEAMKKNWNDEEEKSNYKSPKNVKNYEPHPNWTNKELFTNRNTYNTTNQYERKEKFQLFETIEREQNKKIKGPLYAVLQSTLSSIGSKTLATKGRAKSSELIKSGLGGAGLETINQIHGDPKKDLSKKLKEFKDQFFK